MAGLEEEIPSTTPASTTPASAYSLPRDERTRTEVFASVVNGYIETGKNHCLKILVVGEAGQGKSTLINALVGSEVAKEGDQFVSGTEEINEYRIEQNGVRITIWDTPGFGMGSLEEDAKMVEKLKMSGCENVDLAMFCVRMDSTRFPTRLHHDTISKLHEVFGRKFWRHCLFVLTFANNIEQFCSPGEDIVEYFSQRQLMMEGKFKEALKKNANLGGDELDRVRSVPVGSHRQGKFRENPWALPDREDWFIWFWIECTEHMRSSALSALLRANYHRLEATEALQNSLCCPPPNFEPHDRLLQATKDEISEVRIQIDQENTKIVQYQADDVSLPPATGERRRQSSRPTKEVVSDMLSSMSYSKKSINDAEKGIHERAVPTFETLKKQLEFQNSSFFEYVATYAEERKKERPYFGYLQGFIDALKAYFTSKSKAD